MDPTTGGSGAPHRYGQGGGHGWLLARRIGGPKGEIALTGSEPERPAELYYLASSDSRLERLTDYNRETTTLELGRSETVQWDSDSFHMDGVVTYPPGFAAGKKYPMVLYIHGGPRSASKQAFSSRAQLLAAQGWIVFEPNYRGSDNLGNAFQAGIWNDAGAGPGRDVMAGDNGVPAQFIAYPVTGHSPSDPIHSRDIDRRWIAWLGKYLAP